MIERWRRHTAPLAALLLVLVTMQVMDWPGCADEVRHVVAHATGASHSDPSARPSGPHDPADAGLPDCLCHIVFVPAAPFPAPGGPSGNSVLAPEPDVPLAIAFVLPPEHIPIV